MRQVYNYARNDEFASTFSARIAFRAEAVEDEMQILVDGIIGDPWAGLTAGEIIPKIKEHKGPIRLLFNSPGGLVFDAVSVYYALVEHGDKVYADILGQAASAATVMASAADHVRIGAMGRYHIHRAWSGYLVQGNSTEMRKSLPAQKQIWEQLDQIDETIADMFAARTGRDAEDIYEQMDAKPDGTVFTGKQAVEAGFVDAIIPDKTPAEPAEAADRAAIALRLVKAQLMAKRCGVLTQASKAS